MTATRFTLVRHGQTQWNAEKRIQGRADSPLTDVGVRQARQWGRDLIGSGLTRIVSSDLGRARGTAEFINESLNLPHAADARLREQDWGAWTGMTLTDIRRNDGDRLAQAEAAGWGFQPPGGEDRRQLLKRCRAALAEAADAHPGAHFLVVAHEGVIKSLVYWLAERRFLPEEKNRLAEKPPPILTLTNGRWALEQADLRSGKSK